jgi:uncharacterized surface protein with fasciclin (FAS1) repeats
MQQDGRFGDFVKLLGVSGIGRSAALARPYTVFAPTDAALEPSANMPALLGSTYGNGTAVPDVTGIDRVVRSRTVAGIHPPTEFAGKKVTLESMNGTPIEVDGTQNGTLTVTVRRADQVATQTINTKPLMASNAIIYPVDSVTVTR